MIGSIILGVLEILLRVDNRLRDHEEEKERARQQKIADARRQLELEFKKGK